MRPRGAGEKAPSASLPGFPGNAEMAAARGRRDGRCAGRHRGGAGRRRARDRYAQPFLRVGRVRGRSGRRPFAGPNGGLASGGGRAPHAHRSRPNYPMACVQFLGTVKLPVVYNGAPSTMSRLPLPIDLTVRERSIARVGGIACMVAAVFVFSIMDSLMKRLSSHYGPLQFSCLRCISSWLFLLPPIAWQRTWATLRPSNPRLHLFRAVLGIGMLSSFVFAVHRLSLAQTYSLFLAALLLMTALSVPIHRDQLPGKLWAPV